MPQTGYPILIHPGQQRFIFQRESDYAQPTGGGGVAGPIFLEPATTITTAIDRQPFEANEMAGVSATMFDELETTHHSTVTITTSFRANGIAAWALAALMGSTTNGATDAATPVPTGWNSQAPTPGIPAGSLNHYIVPGSSNNVCNTFTIWHDVGDGQTAGVPGTSQYGLLQMSACTCESIKLTFTPNTAVVAELSFQGNFPIFRAVSGSTGAQNAPVGTIVNLSGSNATYKATRTLGFQGQKQFWNFMDSTLTTTKYTNRILSGDITIARALEVIETPFSQTPTYYLPGPITVTGTVNMLFDGLGNLENTTGVAYGSNTPNPDINTDASTSNSIYQDYLNFKHTGTALNPNQIGYSDQDGNGFLLNFYPIKWTSFGLTASAESLQVNAGFTSYNDLSAALPATGPSKISAMSSVTLINNVAAGTMIT